MRSPSRPRRRTRGATRRPAVVPAPPDAPRWQRRPEERPTEILSAALDSFVERGFTATRLEEVAKRAGVSKGTLYLYFDSKDALFKAVIRENIVANLERAEQQVEAWEGPSRELLAELFHGWWRTLHESRLTGLPKLMFSEAANFPDLARFYFDEVVERGRRLFARVLERGIARGEFRPLDVPYTVRVIMAPVVMALISKHSLVKCHIDAMDYDRHLEALIDIVLNGVVAAPGKERAHA